MHAADEERPSAPADAAGQSEWVPADTASLQLPLALQPSLAVQSRAEGEHLAP